jgi:hypothetical protein
VVSPGLNLFHQAKAHFESEVDVDTRREKAAISSASVVGITAFGGTGIWVIRNFQQGRSRGYSTNKRKGREAVLSRRTGYYVCSKASHIDDVSYSRTSTP